jgi:DNA-binding NarL/FixJ family response regulator
MSRSSSKCVVALVDSKNLRRASISSFIWPWAISENLQPKTFSPDQACEQLHEDTNLRMLILSVGGESIAAPENLQLIRILRALATGVPFTIISDKEDAHDIAAAISMEVQGFINSGMDPWLAHRALSFILNGGSYFPPSAINQFRTAENPAVYSIDRSETQFKRDRHSDIDYRPAHFSYDFESHDAESYNVQSRPLKLTPRQREVLERIRLGQSNKMIARGLGMTEGTVKVHIRQMMRKYSAFNRTQLAIDRVGHAQIPPVLGREVIEGE